MPNFRNSAFTVTKNATGKLVNNEQIMGNQYVANAGGGMLVKALGGFFLMLSLFDIGVDGAEAVSDAATGGVASAVMTPLDILSELVFETIQIIIAIFILYKTEGSPLSKIIKIFILIVLAFTDIFFSILGILPYFDIPETIAEIMSELVSNVLIWMAIF